LDGELSLEGSSLDGLPEREFVAAKPNLGRRISWLTTSADVRAIFVRE